MAAGALERLQRDHGLDELAAAQPGGLPRRAGRGQRRPRARRPHHRGRALPRRDRRLAGLRAHPVRRPGPRAVGHGAAGPAGRAVGPRRRADVERRRHRAAPARGGRRPAHRRAGHRPGRDRGRSWWRSCPRRRMFASRFRECAARALLLPRRRPDRRTPLWQQRQKAADLLAVAANHPDFPILLETTRECINDVFDLPALREVLTDIRSRRVRMVAVETPRASPFAQSLLFGWIGVYMYEGDAPLAERRAAALALDRDLLRDLLGAEELRELIDPVVLADLELELQRLVDGRRARDADEVHDLLRLLGPLSLWEIDARCVPGRPAARPSAWVDQLVAERRAIRVSIAGDERLAAAEDAARLRDALGVALPPGLPAAFTDPVPDPLVDLVARFARTHGPFLAAQVAQRYGAGTRPGRRRARAGSRTRGASCGASSGPTASSASGATTTCCASCAAARWPRCARRSSRSTARPWPGSCRSGTASATARRGPRRAGRGDRVAAGGGAARIGPRGRRVVGPGEPATSPSDLDALCTAGDVVWVGAGPLGVRRRPGAPAVPRPGRPPGPPRAHRRRTWRRPTGRVPTRPSTRPLRAQPGGRGGVVLARAGGGGGRRRRALRRRRRAGRPVGSGVGRRGHQRLAGARCAPWSVVGPDEAPAGARRRTRVLIGLASPRPRPFVDRRPSAPA